MTQTVAQIALGPDDGKAYGVVGHKYRLLATGEQTGGEYAVFEAIVPPGEGPPPHLHVNDDEMFYVATGAITLVVEGREIESGVGSFALVPRGTVHTFRNDGAEAARLVIMIRPAGLVPTRCQRWWGASLPPTPAGDPTRAAGRSWRSSPTWPTRRSRTSAAASS
jgi:mannose-6-phosphate isomerase-like protein (cupin superfamily)